MPIDYEKRVTTNPSGFVLLADYVPAIVQEIRYYSTYNFMGERVDGYEEPCALLTKEAARALKTVSNEMNASGYRLKVFDGTVTEVREDESGYTVICEFDEPQ